MLPGEKESKLKDSKPAKREDQLAHLNMDMPASPQPSSSSTDSTPALNRENSMQSSTSTAHLPPDAQKFLKFAGLSFLYEIFIVSILFFILVQCDAVVFIYVDVHSL